MNQRVTARIVGGKRFTTAEYREYSMLQESSEIKRIVLALPVDPSLPQAMNSKSTLAPHRSCPL